MPILGMKVTVEFICPNMIDEDSLKEDYENDPMKVYLDISDNGKDSILNFTEGPEKVVKIETFVEDEKTEGTT